MRPVPALLALAVLAGCGKPTEPVADVVDTAGPAAVEVAATPPASPQTGCATGPSLPITGLCDDANPALFLKVNAAIEPFAPKCVWKTEEVAMSEDQALVFRSQDCSGEGFPKITFSWKDGALDATYSGAHSLSTLQVFDLPDGQTAEAYALATQETAPEGQRGRCEILPLPETSLAGTGFILSGNEELMAEIAANPEAEIVDICGRYGQTDAVQFWEARPGLALFHAIGQEEPNWDPASYTFYSRSADGSWAKQSQA